MMMLAALLASAAPVAAQPTSIGCIVDKLGSESIARIGGRVVTAIDTKQPLDTALDLDRDALIAARNTCRDANKWSVAQVDTAVSYLKASAALVGSEAALQGDGIDATAFRGGYDGLSEADHASMVGGKSPNPAVKAAVDRLAAMSKATGLAHDAVVRHVTIYFSARSALDYYPTQFAGG